VEQTNDPDLRQALAWSEAVNEQVERFVRDVPPFPSLRRCLEKLQHKADCLVVSATPCEALVREWREHDIERYVQVICGQEMGTKKELLTIAEKYPPDHALMVGDAPGDYQAASANRVLFFPINPGAEEMSWQRLHDEGLGKFFAGTFAGEYQSRLVAEFESYLPAKPPWPVDAA
jgi:phosphoglycolate phosphatase-like HAD superfamily hydrolase